MAEMPRRWVDKVPVGVLVALWVISLFWTALWMWQLLMKSAIYIGPGVLFAVWYVPMLPLFLLTAVRLRRQGKTGLRLTAALLSVGILLFAVPYRLAIASPLLQILTAALVLVPVGATVAALALVLRAARAGAGGELPSPASQGVDPKLPSA